MDLIYKYRILLVKGLKTMESCTFWDHRPEINRLWYEKKNNIRTAREMNSGPRDKKTGALPIELSGEYKIV